MPLTFVLTEEDSLLLSIPSLNSIDVVEMILLEETLVEETLVEETRLIILGLIILDNRNICS